MKLKFRLFDRREFLGTAGKVGAVVGLSSAIGPAAQAQTAGTANPFAYDLSRLEKTDPSLVGYEPAAQWRVPRKHPKRMAIGPDNRVYVCAGNYVTVLTLAGETVLELALPSPACSVAAAKDGMVYAATRDRVEVYDARGNLQGRWEPAGKKCWFTGLAAGANDVFGADSGNRVVFRYDRSGKVVGRIGEKSAERNIPGFVVPSPYLGVEIHPDGLLRVNNPGRHRVEAYTFGGDFEGAWGNPSAAMAGFCGCCNPIAIATLADGRIVTGEKGLPRVKIYSAAGQLESVVAGVETFPENARACADLNDCTNGGLDVAVDSQERVYVLDFVTEMVRAFKRKA